jgi:hypothetical protein
VSVCEHDEFCPGEGAQHDADTLGLERLLNLRGEYKALLRGGNPYRRAVGKALKMRVEAALALLPQGE